MLSKIKAVMELQDPSWNLQKLGMNYLYETAVACVKTDFLQRVFDVASVDFFDGSFKGVVNRVQSQMVVVETVVLRRILDDAGVSVNPFKKQLDFEQG